MAALALFLNARVAEADVLSQHAHEAPAMESNVSPFTHNGWYTFELHQPDVLSAPSQLHSLDITSLSVHAAAGALSST